MQKGTLAILIALGAFVGVLTWTTKFDQKAMSDGLARRSAELARAIAADTTSLTVPGTSTEPATGGAEVSPVALAPVVADMGIIQSALSAPLQSGVLPTSLSGFMSDPLASDAKIENSFNRLKVGLLEPVQWTPEKVEALIQGMSKMRAAGRITELAKSELRSGSRNLDYLQSVFMVYVAAASRNDDMLLANAVDTLRLQGDDAVKAKLSDGFLSGFPLLKEKYIATLNAAKPATP